MPVFLKLLTKEHIKDVIINLERTIASSITSTTETISTKITISIKTTTSMHSVTFIMIVKDPTTHGGTIIVWITGEVTIIKIVTVIINQGEIIIIQYNHIVIKFIHQAGIVVITILTEIVVIIVL